MFKKTNMAHIIDQFCLGIKPGRLGCAYEFY